MIFLNGAGGATTDALLRLLTHPHDIISFSPIWSKANFDRFSDLYQQGLSIREISKREGISKTTLHDHLKEQGLEMRSSIKSKVSGDKKPITNPRGGIPYGFQLFDGRLVMDAKETKIIRRIMKYKAMGMSFNAIAKLLNGEGTPSKLSKKWNDKTVAAIIRRHPDEPK